MKRHILKITVAAGLCLLLFLMLPVAMMASTDVPTLVMQARDGVVRIIAEADGGLSLGTGFVVGQEDDYYVVTNHHVVEATQAINGEIRIYYDTGKYVEGEVYYDAKDRDICVLKPVRDIPDAAVIPLQSEEFDSGLAVYALGYPGAADMLSGDWYTYEKADDIKADKQSMTITDGIISAIRDSKSVGDLSRTVRVVQTNTVINHGNSGGPLLDSYGNVLAINTYGVSEDGASAAAGMYGCVHVSELISVLRAANISYYTAIEAEEARNAAEAEPESTQSNIGPFIIIGVAAVAAVAAIIVVLVAYNKKNKGNTTPLAQTNAASPYAGQNYPVAPRPAQPYQAPSYPGQTGYPGQNYPAQSQPTQSYPTQSRPVQGYPTQGQPTQGYPPQGQPTQGYPTQQSQPTQTPQGQSYPSQNYPGQSGYPGQNYPR